MAMPPLLFPWSMMAALGIVTAVGLPNVVAAAPVPPVVRLYSASDLPQLARGIKLPPEAQYTVKVWAPAQQTWSLAVDGQTLTLEAKLDGPDETPRWQNVGSVDLKADGRVRLLVPLPDAKNALTKTSKSKHGGTAISKPVPAAIVFTTDPEFDPSPALDLIRGRIDSTAPPLDLRSVRVRTNKEGADFHAPHSAHEWRERAQTVCEHLLVTLGLWPLPPKTPLNPQVYGKLERDGYTIEKVVLETLPGFTLSGNLYRPGGKSGQLPIVLCPHGHWEDGRVNPEVQERCIQWAKLGAVVFLYDMVGYNDSKAFGHSFLNDRLRRWGLSLVTLQTWNSIRALDWLTSLPDVDPARVGCTGESGGGTQTFLLTAIDDRIKVSAPVVMVSDSFQGGCVCENAAGLRIGTDNVEFAALTAPRPLKLVGASGDWTKLTLTRAYPAIRDVYDLVGSTDRVHAEVFDFPHNYNQTTRNAVYAFMGRWLLGIHDPESTREGKQTTEKPEALWTFDESHPAPSDRKSPEQLEAALVQTLASQIDGLAPADRSAAWEASKALLLKALKVRVGLKNPTPAELEATTVRQSSREQFTVIHSRVGRKAAGDQIPVVRFRPAQSSGRLTVIATAHGKARLITPRGEPIPLVKALLERGLEVVGYDPLFVGESFNAASPAFHRPNTDHYETYNPALAGDQIQDLATVVAWARSQPDVREVSLIGLGQAGPQVLLARPALEGVSRTAVDLNRFDPKDGSVDLPASLDLPGLLQFGGLKAAAALTAPAPLWIQRAGKSFEASWPEKAYALADVAHVLRLTPESATPEALATWIDTGK
ncbi:Acetyl xylan esterase (AXE1) [Singulisphaera sp. GP187]|uniref:alpha/beta hydrolase family protein n=1 Tax=Singulisphaera sp. GP187 TaxID=1882752 RepID=UPI0009285356|nr:CocE/NonD family hydrolase [Singulisphaera sp. GP187]SIN93334.1 Acetyl xylan esterase (AXE1) [Singulisphaera sp. GP187]